MLDENAPGRENQFPDIPSVCCATGFPVSPHESPSWPLALDCLCPGYEPLQTAIKPAGRRLPLLTLSDDSSPGAEIEISLPLQLGEIDIAFSCRTVYPRKEKNKAEIVFLFIQYLIAHENNVYLWR